jgi:hypothetical protein
MIFLVLLLGISSCLQVSQANSYEGHDFLVLLLGISSCLQVSQADSGLWIHILAVNQEVGWWLSREVKIEIKLLKDLTY